jgi:hypothetical protein
MNQRNPCPQKSNLQSVGLVQLKISEIPPLRVVGGLKGVNGGIAEVFLRVLRNQKEPSRTGKSCNVLKQKYQKSLKED